MMLLLRKLADAGRTVVLVTHATGNIRLCDRVAFMGRGGKLCYYGTPDQAMSFFGLSGNDFADIYNELEQGMATVGKWQEAFLRWWMGVTVTTFLTLLANIGLGLAISAFVKNAAQANSALAFILLSQIILSGVLFELNGVTKIGSWLMLSRWSVGAYATLANVNALGWTPGTDPKETYTATVDNLLLNWGALLLHTIVYLAITLLLQKRKDPIT